MTTPASQTLNFALADIQAYSATPGDAVVVQIPLDNALIAAMNNAVADGVSKTVIVRVVPPAAIQIGASNAVNWTHATCNEYLFPPGDSGALQPQVANPLSDMAVSSSATNRITSTNIVVAPT